MTNLTNVGEIVLPLKIARKLSAVSAVRYLQKHRVSAVALAISHGMCTVDPSSVAYATNSPLNKCDKTV